MSANRRRFLSIAVIASLIVAAGATLVRIQAVTADVTITVDDTTVICHWPGGGTTIRADGTTLSQGHPDCGSARADLGHTMASVTAIVAAVVFVGTAIARVRVALHDWRPGATTGEAARSLLAVARLRDPVPER